MSHPNFSFTGPLVVRSPNWLGDAVMALPAVRNIKSAIGSERLTVATPAKLAPLWRACPFVDDVLSLSQPRKYLISRRELAAGKFQSAILLPNSLRTGMEAWLAGIPNRAGYRTQARRWFLTAAISPPFNPRRQHHSLYFLNLISSLGGPSTATFPELVLPATESGEPDPINKPLLAVCPGAEYGPAKRWPVDRFVEAARELVKRHDFHVVVLGAPGDVPVAEAFSAAMPGSENLAGKTSLNEFMAMLKRARLVLSNDSGAMHVASALGTPTVAIFGSTEPNWTGPLGPRFKVVRRHVPCSPCFLRTCPINFPCMMSLASSTVVDACETVLLSA